MAIKFDYTVKETATNLWRNLAISAASILCIAVTLALVGVAIMTQQGVERATQRWQGDIKFIVFLQPEASPEQIDAVGANLEDSPEVSDATFVDKDAAYAEFEDIFADTPELVESVTPDDLPTSYQVEPVNKDAAAVEDLSLQFEGQPGVMRVVRESEAIEDIQKISGFLTNAAIAVAMVLAGVAVLIVLTTVQLAIYARRREIEVMKLVGASNAFIRLPFMLEGLVQGLLGAVIAIGSLVIFKPVLERSLPSPDVIPLFDGITFTNVEMAGTYVFLGAGGMGVATLAAFIGVSFFLDV